MNRNEKKALISLLTGWPGLKELRQIWNCVTFYHTIPTFNTSEKESFSKTIVEKGEIAGNQHFLLFPQCFLLFPAQILNFKVRIIFSSANASNLDESNILSFGKELSCPKLIKSKQHVNSTIHRIIFSITTVFSVSMRSGYA